MEHVLFLGCTVPVRALNYELSARKVAEALGITFQELDFSCCGFTLKSVSGEAAELIAARNLSIAGEKGLDICTLCSACTSFLTEVNERIKNDKSFRDHINSKLKEMGRQYDGNVKVKHFARILYEDIGLEELKKKVKKKLNLKLAVHYGCHYLKPSEYINFDDPERPTSLDQLIEVTGAESLDYEKKNLCCGGGILGIDEDIALTMSGEKLDAIKAAGADAIVLVCPFCDIMYDINQKKIGTKFDKDYGIPVLYYPQLLGLALGIKPDDLGLAMNRVSTKDLIEKIKKK